jgi:hypothetical protein
VIDLDPAGSRLILIALQRGVSCVLIVLASLGFLVWLYRRDNPFN